MKYTRKNKAEKQAEQISDLEDRMLEITAAKQNIEKKNEKKNEDSLRVLQDNTPTFILQGSHKDEREREKGSKKIFEEIRAENFPNVGKETVSQVQEAESRRQDKPKEEHSQTHSNQTDKN